VSAAVKVRELARAARFSLVKHDLDLSDNGSPSHRTRLSVSFKYEDNQLSLVDCPRSAAQQEPSAEEKSQF